MELIPFTRKFKMALLFLIGLILSCNSIPWQKAAKSGTTQGRFLADISYLADDKMEGRAFGTVGEVKAGNYIARRFKLVNLEPRGEKGTWFQSLTVKKPSAHGVEFSTTIEPGSQSGRNVIGYLNHNAPLTIILGAHYDHLGMGTTGSLHMGEPAIHNGADDNASGIALILELADRLKTVKSFNYLFVAFTGEENGLWGSNYFCDHPTIDLKSVTAMLNFDMVGRLNSNTKKMAVNGVGTSSAWPGLVKSANTFNLDISSSESGIGPSDHTSFYLEDIPVLHFFTGAHEDYHKPTDDVHLINAGGIDLITSMVVNLIKLMDSADKLPFSKSSDPDPSTTPKMEVTMGVLPDYLYDGKGLRIDAVRDGKPAQLAGLEKGDIVIQIGGEEIKDIYEYMKVLAKFHKGDKTTVKVLRGEKELQYDIHF